jgi:hypothetical protein
LEKKRKAKKVKRKSFAAREDLLAGMNKVAKENDFSLYGFVNEVFKSTLRVNKLGVNLNTLIDSRELLKDAREKGYTLGLESLWYEMSNIAYDKAKKKSIQTWFDAGIWLAKRYVTGDTEDPFEAFKNDLKDFTWNIPELELNNNEEKDKLSIRIVSPRIPEAYTFLFKAFLEGALETFGYKINSKEVSRGIIILEAVKE